MTPSELRYTVAVRLREIETELVSATDEEAAELAQEMAGLSELVDGAEGAETTLLDATTQHWLARVEYSRNIAQRVAAICEELRDPDLDTAEEADLLAELEECQAELDQMGG